MEVLNTVVPVNFTGLNFHEAGLNRENLAIVKKISLATCGWKIHVSSSRQDRRDLRGFD